MLARSQSHFFTSSERTNQAEVTFVRAQQIQERQAAKTEADERTIQDCFGAIEKKHLPHVLSASNPLAPGGAVVVKYDLEGTVVSSSTFADAESFDRVAVNANGVYLAGKGASGFVTVKYGHDLAFSTAAVLPGENHARDLALDAGGNVYVIGSDAGEPISNNDYKFVKYDADLNQVGLPVLFDAGGMEWQRVKVPKDPGCGVCSGR